MRFFFESPAITIRRLRKAPAFALLAVLTLAVGIGPTTAVFAVFRQVLLREMPVEKPGEIVLLREHSAFETGSLSTNGGSDELYFAYPAYRVLRDQATARPGHPAVLRGLAAANMFAAKIVTAKDADQTRGQMVSGNYFNVLGARPVLGRLLMPEDDREGSPNPVAILSEAYWRSRFSADPSVLDRPMEINGVQFTVVGITRHSGIMDANTASVFVPITMQAAVSSGKASKLDDALNRWMVLLGRTQPGVSRAQAAAVLNTVWWNWRRDVLHERRSKITNAKGWLQTNLQLENGARGISLLGIELGQSVMELQALALLVLLISCANLANLLLAKAARSRAELAVRMALGAGRGRIMNQVIAEALLVGAAGTGAGLLLGWVSLRVLGSLLHTSHFGGIALTAQWDWPVLLFAVSVGLATSLLFSIAPALASARVDPAELLHGQVGMAGRSRARFRGLLVSAEIALCVLLLASATLFGWNLFQLHNTNPGFSVARLLTFRVDASAGGTASAEVAEKYGEILRGLQREPGAQQAAYCAMAMLGGNRMGDNVTVAGFVEREADYVPDENWVSPDFFSTLGIPLLRGRAFTDGDSATTERVAIVDQAFVQHYYGGDAAKALSGHFGFGSGDHAKLDIAIVGVVPTVHTNSLSNMPHVPFIYLPYAQTYSALGVHARDHPATFYLRTSSDPTAFAGDVHALVHRVDRFLPVDNLEPMQERFDASIADTRAMSVLTLLMGALALLLAAVGMYGVLAFLVATRRHEIALRMAVGASRGRVVALVLRQVGRLTVAGILGGGLLSWAALHLLAGRVPALLTAPLWLYALPPLAIAGAALAAALVPAHRAASTEPMQVLRSE